MVYDTRGYGIVLNNVMILINYIYNKCMASINNQIKI